MIDLGIPATPELGLADYCKDLLAWNKSGLLNQKGVVVKRARAVADEYGIEYSTALSLVERAVERAAMRCVVAQVLGAPTDVVLEGEYTTTTTTTTTPKHKTKRGPGRKE